ncbi:MAG: hypothetical protein A2X25_07815 [Chloroflexi bacterium GWB2_49_20]|nr:MAG: hypothetical protein A2X25_07815 [Chloroflexi bacterium GWB2_49_20]OGN78059.1 MAG: hypothetical protein A2X26_15620 [Chloroflexi bacterium GWC2_49_37]OGN85097.1 MAG: hypothetical protein A2X27_10320 [Chloroflexi bacterium GWD2_49_16]
MPELPRKKVGIVACSGEELAEGTVTRLAALKVLEQLRPADTVTICLPLFLAGGEGDRAFARFYPTVAIDGCDQRCAARATKLYSGKPAASVVVTDLIIEHGLGKPEGLRSLNPAGLQTVEVTALHVAGLVDSFLDKHWDRRRGEFIQEMPQPEAGQPVEATCSCVSGIPIQKVEINGKTVTLVALPLIFEQFRQDGKMPANGTLGELLETVRVYNAIPAAEEETYAAALLLAYLEFCKNKEAAA